MAEEVRQIEDEPIIEVEGFRAAYGRRTVLENLTFHIRRGEIFIIGGGRSLRKEHGAEAHDRLVRAGRGANAH